MRRFAARPCHLAIFGGLLAAALAVSAGAQSFYHRYIMKGSIVEADDKGVYLCIGTHDGATAGQELDVYHVSQVPAGPKGGIRLKRDKVGRVRIDEVVDEHFAKASVIEGKAEKGDIVELESEEKPPKK